MEHCVRPDGWPDFLLFLLALWWYVDFYIALYIPTALPSIYIQIAQMKKMKRPNIKKLQKKMFVYEVCVCVCVCVWIPVWY